ncbi:MAG: cytochrome P450 [Comamonadaceae bacterium]|nr:MAG: cytochrome P450 [Comamonadaceae bacterium]
MTTDLTAPVPAPIYDPSDDATRRNPFPLYEALQMHDPVHWSEALRCWIITRYDDVRQVALSPTMSSDRLRPFYESLKDERRDILSGVMRYLSLWLVFKAPPEHTRLRKLLNSVFTLGMIQSLEPQIRGTVQHIFDQVDEDRQVDFMTDIAVLLPAYVILDMLGVPRTDFAMIKVWSDDLRLFIGTSRGEEDKYRKAREGADNMSAYFREVILQRRQQPGDDVISKMIAVHDDHGALTEDELVATCMLILFGGHETTTNLLGSAVVALLDNPGELQRLQQKPELIDLAVEEFLRYDGPSNSIARVVATDHELHGKPLKAGDRVFAMINAANRDPRRFERPHELDLGRTPNRHLTFGQGLHFCLGAPLARLEARICIGELVQRYPRMHHGEGEVEWMDALVMRGPTRLPLRLK